MILAILIYQIEVHQLQDNFINLFIMPITFLRTFIIAFLAMDLAVTLRSLTATVNLIAESKECSKKTLPQ